MSGVEFIQEALAPILLISGAGLISLALQNRYGRVIDRIRQFDDELRRARQSGDKITDSRFRSVKIQTRTLLRRGLYLRNAMSSLFMAILLASVTSIIVLFQQIMTFEEGVIIGVFGTALVFLLTGAYFAVKEILLSYDAIKTEINTEGFMDILNE